MFCLAQIKQLEDLKEVLYLRTLHLSSIIILFKVHPEIAERALLVVRRHLEVLAGPLVILSLAADRLDPEEKEAMGKRLHELRDHWSPGAMPLVRAAAPPELIQS